MEFRTIDALLCDIVQNGATPVKAHPFFYCDNFGTAQPYLCTLAVEIDNGIDPPFELLYSRRDGGAWELSPERGDPSINGGSAMTGREC